MTGDGLPELLKLWFYLFVALLLTPVALAARSVCAALGHRAAPSGRVCARCGDWIPREGDPQ